MLEVQKIFSMEVRRRYPVGTQTFSVLRENGFLYIDKTEYVYRMTHSDSNYLFLSRPRRFGKSLLVSTLHSYFEGRRELFQGLAIEKLETEWNRHPVLHFDMSMAKHVDKEQLESMLDFQLRAYETQYALKQDVSGLNNRLANLIRQACKQSGKQVVVLIDEYDAPLLDVVHEETNLPALRDVMRNFYSPLKACDPYLRFVFLTGITKFSQLSIFSELNNVSNISMHPDYAALCGISEEELREQMRPDVALLAEALGMDEEEALARLKEMYDGYHFCWPSPDIYNPYSLLSAFSNWKIASYWFGSGTPTFLIEMLRKYALGPAQLGQPMEAQEEDFDAPTETMHSIMPLLYQSGYVTMKGKDPDFQTYTLGIPNKEVRLGLMRSLVPYYLTADTRQTSVAIVSMARALRRNDMEGCLREIQAFLSTVPYCDNTDYEGHYQQVLYIIFSLLGAYADVEVHTPRGRVDVVMCSENTLYLIELKLGKDAGAAMEQINLKDYAERFALCSLPIVKVGISFDREKRTIAGWKIEPGIAIR